MNEDQDSAAGIGWVAVESAKLEETVAWLEARLLDSRLAFMVAFGQGWAPTRDATLALLRQREQEALDVAQHMLPRIRELCAMIKEADDLMNQRNDVVHAIWLDRESPGVGASLRLQRWGKGRSRTWSLRELEDLRHKLWKIDLDINMAMSELDLRQLAGG